VEICVPHAIQIRQTGSPEVLNWTPIELGEPGSVQVRLRQAAAGLNYIDVYHRTEYHSQPLPFIFLPNRPYCTCSSVAEGFALSDTATSISVLRSGMPLTPTKPWTRAPPPPAPS
jgi:hypothetical protein